MKKILFTLLLSVFLMLSCKTSSIKSVYSYAPESIIEICSEKYFTQVQLDSLVLVDTLPNIGMWMNLSLLDFDSRTPVRKKFHFDVKKRTTYVITFKSDSAFMTIRK